MKSQSIKPIKPTGRKTFQKDGHWIEKPDRTVILVCVCGGKYIKTRAIQISCLRCVGKIL
ncbi:MAG: hypothetical protein Q7S86_02010 [bacterium]|nr:hypothetical protein [bacterium]